MAVQETIDALVAEVAEDVTVMDGATALVNGISDRITAAVAAAVANGATEAQLAPLTNLASDLDAAANRLSSAVSANTPAA
jgi:NH3-dependent NAD+ synthetase